MSVPQARIRIRIRENALIAALVCMPVKQGRWSSQGGRNLHFPDESNAPHFTDMYTSVAIETRVQTCGTGTVRFAFSEETFGNGATSLDANLAVLPLALPN